MRRRRKRSPGRSSSSGLLFVLIVAAIVGVAAGSYLANHFSVPYVKGAAISSAPEASREPARGHHREQRHRAMEIPSPPGQPSTDAQAGKATIKEEAPTPDTPPARKRVQTYPSEIAYANGNEVALTFDAGASAAPARAILAALKSTRLRVTFFLTGKWCEENEGTARQIIAAGHEIANHTYSHPDLRKLTDEEIREQIEKTDSIVLRVTGQHCAPYLRPPFGARDERVLQVVSNAGYTPIYWSLDSWDSVKKGITSQEIADRVLGRIQGGDIVLMHCGSQATAEALPDLIKEIQRRGFRIVKVSRLVGA